MSRLVWHPDVDEDLLRIVAYLASQNAGVADRFVDAAVASMKDAARRPTFGSPKPTGFQVAGLRTWRIAGFPKHLVYYVPTHDGIRVLAVAHGAQSVGWLLAKRG